MILTMIAVLILTWDALQMTAEEKKLNDFLIEVIKHNHLCQHCELCHENELCFFASECIKNDFYYYQEED